MEPQPKTLPSGAEFLVGRTPFPISYGLYKAILGSLRGIAGEGKVDWKAFLEKDVAALVGPVIEVATSPAVDAMLFQALAYCAWNKQKVVRDLFEDPEQGDAARRDFYAMATECVRANCTPFFEGAFSGLKAAVPARAAVSPPSK